MIHKIKDAEQAVLRMLQRCEECRNDDLLLMVKIWCEQNPELRTRRKDITVEEFFTAFLRHAYMHPETVRRTRQQIVKDNPGLAGTNRRFRKHLGEQMTFEMSKRNKS